MRGIDEAVVIDSIAGWCGRRGYNGDGKFPVLKTKFNDPIGIVEDAAGTMYVAEQQNARVRTISTDGIVSTILGAQDAAARRPRQDARHGHPDQPPLLSRLDAADLYVSDFL